MDSIQIRKGTDHSSDHQTFIRSVGELSVLILKFGGTSVGSVQAVQRVASVVQSHIEQSPVVVFLQ
ncbi:MAG: hypothetical protein WKH64_00330 [Chloroflexia bacterium]